MPREASLFDDTAGSPVRAFFALRRDGGNIPPAWIERSRQSRKSRHAALAKLLKRESINAVPLLEDWELAFRKECFYLGLRILLELEREGKTKL